MLTGAGKYFCVGADFNGMEGRRRYPDGHPGLLIESVGMARNILAVRVPLISAINGDAIGIGATISLFCDIVYMAETARIADPHVQAGIVAGDGGAVLWPLLMGPNRAKEYLMTGDLRHRARSRPPRAGQPRRPARAGSWTTRWRWRSASPTAPAVAIRFNKRLVNKELEMRVSQLYDLSVAFEAITFETADHREAVDAFLDKRAPVFRPAGREGEGTQP